jgi:hypothetical protein
LAGSLIRILAVECICIHVLSHFVERVAAPRPVGGAYSVSESGGLSAGGQIKLPFVFSSAATAHAATAKDDHHHQQYDHHWAQHKGHQYRLVVLYLFLEKIPDFVPNITSACCGSWRGYGCGLLLRGGANNHHSRHWGREWRQQARL